VRLAFVELIDFGCDWRALCARGARRVLQCARSVLPVETPVHPGLIRLKYLGSTIDEQKAKFYDARMEEGRKRVLGIMAAILASLHMQTADDLFGGPQGSPRTDKLIAASVQWADEIMRKIDAVFRQ